MTAWVTFDGRSDPDRGKTHARDAATQTAALGALQEPDGPPRRRGRRPGLLPAGLHGRWAVVGPAGRQPPGAGAALLRRPPDQPGAPRRGPRRDDAFGTGGRD